MQTRFLLAHTSFIVLKGLSAVISSLEFLASIRYCSTESELRQLADEGECDIIIATKSMAQALTVPPHTELLLLDHGIKTDDMFTISWEDSKDTVVYKIKAAVQRHQQYSEDGEELSMRERDIVRQVALGHTNQEIADALFISAHTVITHRKNIVRKLGIKTVSGLTVYAILNNLLRMDEMNQAK